MTGRGWRGLRMAVAGLVLLASPSAFAACTTPTGAAGDIVYSSNTSQMAYCNGTSWVNMGSSSAVSFGTLTTGDFCLATSGTAISCTTATVNLSSQASGTLQAAQVPAFTGDMTNTAGSLATTVGSIGGKAVSLGSAFTTSGANSLILTTTGATNVTLPTSGTLITNAVTSLPSLAGVGTIISGVWNGTAITVPYGGTGDTALTQYGVLLGNGTGAVNTTAVGATGTVLTGNTGANPTFSASPSLTNLTLSGAEMLGFASDYTTVGTAQSDVAINTTSAVRYNGTATATFYGIAAGTPGQILHLHNASSYILTLSNQSPSDTTAASRIITGTGSDLAMAANSSVTLQYDGTAARWRVIGGSGGGIPAGSSGQVQFNSGSNTFAASSNLTWDNTNYRLGIGSSIPAYSLDASTGTVAGTTMHVNSDGVAVSASGVTGGITFNTAATGQMAYYSAASTISGTPNLYVSGSNIGIGTSTPTNLLSLSGTAAQTLWMERGTTVGNNLTVQAGGGLSGGSNEAGGNLILSSGISTGTGGSMIQFKTYAPGSSGTSDNAATTAMTIGSAGNVGIGTATPANLLTVYGSNATYATAWATNSNASGVALMGYNSSSGAYGQIGTGSYAGIFLNGNVGIGTTAPTALLDVSSASTNSTFMNITNTASSGHVWTLYSSGGGPANVGNFGIYDSTSGGNRLVINTAGNVGIGVSSPSYKLHVSDSAGNIAIYASESAANSYGVYGSVSATSSYGAIGYNTSSAYFCQIGTGSYSIACSGPTSGTSDGRLKKDIVPFSEKEGLSAVMQMRPVHYRWKDDRMNKAHPGGEIGFIAQNMETAMPELVGETKQDKNALIKLPGGMVKGISYERITAPLVKAVQELKSLFDADHTAAAADHALLLQLKADNDNLRRDFDDYRKAHP